MKQIPLGKEKFTIVDDEDFEVVNKFKWQISNTGYVMRCAHIGYISGKRIVKGILLHRFLSEVEKHQYIDHIDGNRLNNCKSNLRVCTLSENQCNKGRNKNNKSGYKGVCWHIRQKKWVAQIEVKAVRKYLGCFDCPIEAAKAYNEAAIKYHGEFARLNQIPV